MSGACCCPAAASSSSLPPRCNFLETLYVSILAALVTLGLKKKKLGDAGRGDPRNPNDLFELKRISSFPDFSVILSLDEKPIYSSSVTCR
jgi:hypothetical protein